MKLFSTLSAVASCLPTFTLAGITSNHAIQQMKFLESSDTGALSRQKSTSEHLNGEWSRFATPIRHTQLSASAGRGLKASRLFDAAAPSGIYDFDYEQYNDYFGEENYNAPALVLLKDIFFEPVNLNAVEVDELTDHLCDLVESLASPLTKSEVAAFSTPETECETVFSSAYCEFASAEISLVVDSVPRTTVLAIERSLNENIEDMFKSSTDLSSKLMVVPPPAISGVPYTDSGVYPMPRSSITSMITFEGINLKFLHDAPGLNHDEHSLCKLAAEGAATAFTASGSFQKWVERAESTNDVGCWEVISSHTENSVTVKVSLEAPFLLDFSTKYDIACNAVEAVKASLDSGISAHSLFGTWGTSVIVNVGMEVRRVKSDVTPECSVRGTPTDVQDYADAMSPFGDYTLDYMSPSLSSSDYTHDNSAIPAAAPADYTWDYSTIPAAAPGWNDYSWPKCTSFIKDVNSVYTSSPPFVLLSASSSSLLLQNVQEGDGYSGANASDDSSGVHRASRSADSGQDVGSSLFAGSSSAAESGSCADAIGSAGSAEPDSAGECTPYSTTGSYGEVGGAEGSGTYDGSANLDGSYGK